NEIIKGLSEIAARESKGPKSLYTACYAGIEQAKGSVSHKRAIIVFSDNTNNFPGVDMDLDKLRRFLLENNVVIYAIDVDWLLHPSNRKGMSSSDSTSLAEELEKLQASERRS